MAKTRDIDLPAAITPADALDVARRELERQGFLWEQVSASQALAHEGGKKISGRTSYKLRLGLTAGQGRLTLQRQTNGADGYFFPQAGLTIQILLGSKFKKVGQHIEQALRG